MFCTFLCLPFQIQRQHLTCNDEVFFSYSNKGSTFECKSYTSRELYTYTWEINGTTHLAHTFLVILIVIVENSVLRSVKCTGINFNKMTDSINHHDYWVTQKVYSRQELSCRASTNCCFAIELKLCMLITNVIENHKLWWHQMFILSDFVAACPIFNIVFSSRQSKTFLINPKHSQPHL